MDDTIDTLKIKIEKARAQLPSNTLYAIDAVPWQEFITELREKNGFTFEQLGDLETETELLLCGLLNSRDYPKELEKRMGIPKAAVGKLVDEMNNGVFSKIREEMIKRIEGTGVSVGNKGGFVESENNNSRTNDIMKSAGIEIIPEKLELAGNQNMSSTLAKKLTSSVSAPIAKTDHSLTNLTPSNAQDSTKPKIDPYREIPE